jgi:hypothetical protein
LISLDWVGYQIPTGYDEIRLGGSYLDVAPIAAPASPTGMTAVVVNGIAINLNWTDNAVGATGCHVQRSTDDTTWTTIATLAANANNYKATGLTPGTTYYFHVSAYNTSGDSVAPTVTQMAPIAGDINCDGLVDVADYDIWAANVGATNATWTMGDLNGDGLVDVADYDIWAANVGATASSTSDLASQAALPAVSASISSTPASSPEAPALPDVGTSSRIDLATVVQTSDIPLAAQEVTASVWSPAQRTTSLAVARSSDFDMLAHIKALQHAGHPWAGVDGRPGDFTGDLLASPLDDFDLQDIQEPFAWQLMNCPGG